MQDITPLLKTPTTSVQVAAGLLGINRSTAYAAIRNNDFPTPVVKIGGRYVVPTRPLLELLGLTDDLPGEVA